MPCGGSGLGAYIFLDVRTACSLSSSPCLDYTASQRRLDYCHFSERRHERRLSFSGNFLERKGFFGPRTSSARLWIPTETVSDLRWLLHGLFLCPAVLGKRPFSHYMCKTDLFLSPFQDPLCYILWSRSFRPLPYPSFQRVLFQLFYGQWLFLPIRCRVVILLCRLSLGRPCFRLLRYDLFNIYRAWFTPFSITVSQFSSKSSLRLESLLGKPSRFQSKCTVSFLVRRCICSLHLKSVWSAALLLL